MGYKSTKELTRLQALREIMLALTGPDVTDEELSLALEALVGERECHNYRIVSEEELRKINEDE